MLLSGFLSYGLGAGIASYLGASVEWGVYIWGQIWATTLQAGIFFVNYYYESSQGLTRDEESNQIKIFSGFTLQSLSLLIGLACCTAIVPVTLLMLSTGILIIPVAIWMVVSSVFFMVYILPPFRLIESGYGEVMYSFFVALWIPVFSFLLQYGEYSNIVFFVSLPLIPNLLAMILAYRFRDYSYDVQIGRINLLTRVGWRVGAIILVVSIILSTLLTLVIYFLGYPRFVVVTGLVLFPFGLVYSWLVYRITSGERPHWSVFTFTGSAFFILMLYLFTFGFWTS